MMSLLAVATLLFNFGQPIWFKSSTPVATTGAPDTCKNINFTLKPVDMENVRLEIPHKNITVTRIFRNKFINLTCNAAISYNNTVARMHWIIYLSKYQYEEKGKEERQCENRTVCSLKYEEKYNNSIITCVITDLPIEEKDVNCFSEHILWTVEEVASNENNSTETIKLEEIASKKNPNTMVVIIASASVLSCVLVAVLVYYIFRCHKKNAAIINTMPEPLYATLELAESNRVQPPTVERSEYSEIVGVLKPNNVNNDNIKK